MIGIKYATLYILSNKYSMKVNKVKRHAMASMFFKRERFYQPMCNLSLIVLFFVVIIIILFDIYHWVRNKSIWKKNENYKLKKKKETEKNYSILFWKAQPWFNEIGRFRCKPGRQSPIHTELSDQV